MVSTETNRVWNWGPPPCVGWWNASSQGNRDMWRWWDGARWSKAAFPGNSSYIAALHAAKPEGVIYQAGIQWSDYWPEGAAADREIPKPPRRKAALPDPNTDWKNSGGFISAVLHHGYGRGI